MVGKFVEFYGDGVASVPVENRATIGNMSPEYGSTCAIFPIDDQTLRYLEFTGRPAELVALVEAYAKEQGLWHDPANEPVFSEVVELDLSTVRPSLAGPSRPQDRVPLERSKAMFRSSLSGVLPDSAKAADAARRAAEAGHVHDGGIGPRRRPPCRPACATGPPTRRSWSRSRPATRPPIQQRVAAEANRRQEVGGQ